MLLGTMLRQLNLPCTRHDSLLCAQVCGADKVRTMAGVPLEAVLSAETPQGLVPTVAFTTARCMHRAHQRQTWLLQAYCNRGTLAVRLPCSKHIAKKNRPPKIRLCERC